MNSLLVILLAIFIGLLAMWIWSRKITPDAKVFLSTAIACAAALGIFAWWKRWKQKRSQASLDT